MSKMTPAELAKKLASGLLSFPVTHFDAAGKFDQKAYRDHYAFLSGHKVAGLFAAGGTGEFFSLTPSEVDTVVRAAVDENKGRVPLLAGAGYGTALAMEMAQAAERAGADGILLFPPYLITPNQDGLVAHVDAVCKSVKIGVVVYNRDNAILTDESVAKLCDRNANLVGFKDGVGDVELMTRVHQRLGDRLTYIGGLPTAETFALPYLEMGVTTYSSAIFNFMPEWALKFYDAVRARDHAYISAALNDFVLPYIAIRNANRGYAVSIVKAGLKAIGHYPGPVRAPLTDLTPAEFEKLAVLVDRAQAALASRKGPVLAHVAGQH
jgi:5-dehydro-4-deoxyglucarate dehydratase